MLDTYDMQMTDYYTDLDIQMHASSSDQWFQDEAKMEEDAPALKLENSFILKNEGHLPMKADPYAQEKSEATIEVDMEPVLNHQNAECDMLDDEEIHDSSADIEDVEVYDASHGHSPAMGAVDALHGTSTFLDAFERTETNDPLNYNVSPEPLDFGQEKVDPRELESDSTEGVSNSQEGENVSSAHVPQSGAESRTVTLVEPLEPGTAQKSEVQLKAPIDESHAEEFPTADAEVSQLETLTQELVESSHADSSETLCLADEASHSNPDEKRPLAQPTSNPVSDADDSPGDPHEISEGVYIDPPPPVLLSLVPQELFTFALFNEPLEWNPPRTSTGHLLLHQLPTLYYEPLSSVFEALRHEEVIKSTFPLAEGELVLDAIDLQLSISEDNIYAREVALHDLNVLHDVSGISGLLRMKLYISTPRFIVQYQQLQTQVAQLNFEQPVGEVSGGGLDVAEEESTEEKDQETIQRLPEPEDHHWELSKPFSKTSQSNGENSYDEKEHNDPRAKINHEEEPAPDEGTQNHDDPSKSAKELYDESREENGEEGPQEQYDENYEGNYEETYEDYEENPENYHTPEQVLSALSDVPQSTIANSHNASRSHPSEQGNNDVSPLNSRYPDQESNVIPLEVLEADSIDGGFVEEQVSNDSHQEETGPQLSQIVDKLNEGDVYKESLEHSDETTINVHENLETSSIEGSFEQHVSYVQTEQNGEIAISEPTLEDSSTIRGVLNPNSIDLEADDYPLNLESTEGPTTCREDSWESDPDGEGEIDETWDDENENTHSNTNQTSITLSSKASKRSFDEFESGGEGYDDAEGEHWPPPSSPDPKRSRTE